ncbi:unnamed protein product, partial [Dicrocoelium dendriticum]
NSEVQNMQFASELRNRMALIEQKCCNNAYIPNNIRRALDPQEIHELNFLFQTMDRDNDDLLSERELRMAMRALGFTNSNSKLEIYFGSQDNDKRFTLCEFLELVMVLQKSGEDVIAEILQGFKEFDLAMDRGSFQQRNADEGLCHRQFHKSYELKPGEQSPPDFHPGSPLRYHRFWPARSCVKAHDPLSRGCITRPAFSPVDFASLISIASKLLASVILHRLTSTRESQIREEQAGFRRDRG